jgi:hypothetical protein
MFGQFENLLNHLFALLNTVILEFAEVKFI